MAEEGWAAVLEVEEENVREPRDCLASKWEADEGWVALWVVGF